MTSGLLIQWKMIHLQKSIFTLFSPYIPLFKANNSRHPSLQVESHCWGTTAIVVKTKEERWGSRPPVTWERPGPVHAFATHTHKRATTDDTKAGREKDNGVQPGGGQQRSERKGPRLLFPSSISFHLGYWWENRCNLPKRRGDYYVSCVSFT